MPLVRRIHEGITPRHYATIDFERKPLELPGAERFEIRIDLQRIKFFGPKRAMNELHRTAVADTTTRSSSIAGRQPKRSLPVYGSMRAHGAAIGVKRCR